MITLCVKLNKILHDRINRAAQHVNLTPDEFINKAILNYLEKFQIENNNLPKLYHLVDSSDHLEEVTLLKSSEKTIYRPFYDLCKQIIKQYDQKRALITSAWRISETKIVPKLLEQVRQSTTELEDKIRKLAFILVTNLRNKSFSRIDTVQKILHEFSLSSPEGISLMCLAEALLRIPDKPTRDALIKDKIGKGNWQTHLGASDSLFVNATTWGLLITGRILNYNPSKLSYLLNRIILKSGEPIIRKSMDIAIRTMGKNFIIGENLSEALYRSQKLELQGFRYSYDMLGEAALTYKNAKDYFISYKEAIHAIGKASNGRGIYEGPGISIKLSALHPRYNRSQYDRIINELYPILKELTLLARQYDIAINIDAEESDRLEISLDLLEKLCFEPELSEWNGIGFVIQSYQKRCPFVIDSIIDLAQRSNHRLMIRLVKGAYWDTEIKRAQIEGLEDYPVYTRKIYTDISYLACAEKLLAVPKFIYPQFATHNAHTLATIYYLAGNNYYSGQYEFQCLHGMGENLYNQIVGSISKGKMNRPCRIYAPIGNYEKLLSYLVRRLLENGANTSFVNRLTNKAVSIEELIGNPVKIVDKMSATEGTIGLPNPKIPLPINLYGAQRINSIGIDLNNEKDLSLLSNALLNSSTKKWYASSFFQGKVDEGCNRKIINPAEEKDIVGYARDSTENEVNLAIISAEKSWKIWSVLEIKKRTSILDNAATLMQNRINILISLLVREAGKTLNNAISEVREAIDFLRYYSSNIHDFDAQKFIPLGPVVCISPWNFPLAIFIGQIAAALAAGNSVIAKPAEQTPLIATQAVKILYDAGVPNDVLQLIIGKGSTIGSILIKNDRVKGVIFTGSTSVATSIQKILAARVNNEKKTIPFIAETGGINAMIVDSSALTEQVVLDIISSAFDSAGQRCSALRLLCIQEEVADQTLNMLRGAIAEYRIGNPDRLTTDIGPVINMQSKKNIELHIQAMQSKGFKIYQPKIFNDSIHPNSNFVLPTLIEINKISELQTEVFGPILHIVRFSRKNLSNIINDINASGYGLTMGIHSRIDETVNKIIKKAQVGNLYVNKNIVGAVVGVQPFGGQGLSGTGPKAGGPLYLYKLLSNYPEKSIHATLSKYEKINSDNNNTDRRELLQPLNFLISWAKQNKKHNFANLCKYFQDLSITNTNYILPGPTGEKNTYSLLPRKGILCFADNESDLLIQLAAVASVGSKVLLVEQEFNRKIYNFLPIEIKNIIIFVNNQDIIISKNTGFDTVLYHGDSSKMGEICIKIANRDGEIIPVYGFSQGETKLFLERLILERTLSINTTAVGGNTSLITLN
ncbi:MAG: trifunctional transcriptional regulator/proline dehydrogenase/L-glutamate gamma-semialdehyde dehydrogenase [Candidatus Dasytiphilus stammeri]